MRTHHPVRRALLGVSLLLVGAVGTVLGVASPALACSCAMPELSDVLDRSDHAAIVDIVGPGAAEGSWTVEVLTPVKGGLATGEVLDVFDEPPTGAGCGLAGFDGLTGPTAVLLDEQADATLRYPICTPLYETDEVVEAGAAAGYETNGDEEPPVEPDPGDEEEPDADDPEGDPTEVAGGPVADEADDNSLVVVGGAIVLVSAAGVGAWLVRRRSAEG